MWMPARLTVPPGRDRRERDRHELPGRREHDGAVARAGRRLVGVADPVGAELRARARGDARRG